MESQTNKEIREILEMFGVEVSKVIKGWNIIGHLKNAADNHLKRETEQFEGVMPSE